METDLGVALLHSVRDSLIWRVTAGRINTEPLLSVVLQCILYKTWSSVFFGAYTKEDITLTPIKHKTNIRVLSLRSLEKVQATGTRHFYCR